MNMTLSGCTPSSINSTSTAYYDNNYIPLGSNSIGVNYAVYQAAPPLPTSVSVGETGTYGTQNLYTDSTKATGNGSIVQSYVVEADTSTTAILNRISKHYNAAGNLTATEQDRYRIATVGALDQISADVQYATGVHLVITYTNPTPTSIAITPSQTSVVIGSTTNFTATGTYTNGDTANITNQVTWTSSNNAVATINSNGLATSVSAGSANISASIGGIASNTAVLTATLPHKPFGVFAVSGNGQVTVSWFPAIGATSYNIYWGTTPGITTASYKFTSATSPYIHPGLTTGNTYYYRVSTVSAQGEFLSDETFTSLYTGGNPSGSFSATGSMTNTRMNHTATLLTNGKVLITGGGSPGSVLASAEIYDPTTGIFTATGSMAAARGGHTATLLANGKVLIAGGNASGSLLASAEIYDPTTGIFTATGSMANGVSYHTATLLPNGKVLIIGRASLFGNPEIYDPTTGSFSGAGNMVSGRTSHTATLLPNGKVLITGGAYINGSPEEIYDPTTGKFTATGSMAEARYYHTATLLPNSKVLITGGSSPGTVASAEIYDSTTGIFTPTGSMANGRWVHTATLLPNGKVLVTGGRNATSGFYLTSAEIYDTTTGIFATTGSMATGRYSHTATQLSDGKVLVIGGYGIGPPPGYVTGPFSSAELFQ